MIPFARRPIDRENRCTRPIRGLVHTPTTPLLHHLGGTHGAASHLSDDAGQTPQTVTHVAGLFRYRCIRLHMIFFWKRCFFFLAKLSKRLLHSGS